MNFTHGNVLVDYHPAGIFHVTAGFFVGNSSLGIHGFMADWRNNNAQAKLLPGYQWPSVNLLDQKIDLTDGKANIDFQLGGIVKPYLGIGVGRAISKNKKLAVKFELGALYLGEYTLKQNGKKLDLSKSTDPDIKEAHDILKQITAYPLMNLQLTYRIF